MEQVGYAGGEIENPSYQDVCTGQTNHNEVVRVRLQDEWCSSFFVQWVMLGDLRPGESLILTVAKILLGKACHALKPSHTFSHCY